MENGSPECLRFLHVMMFTVTCKTNFIPFQATSQRETAELMQNWTERKEKEQQGKGYTFGECSTIAAVHLCLHMTLLSNTIPRHYKALTLIQGS